MKIKKDSWHYSTRNFVFKILISRKINFDINVTKRAYIVEVILALILYIPVLISALLTILLDKIGIAEPLNNLIIKIKKKIRGEEKYIKFI